MGGMPLGPIWGMAGGVLALVFAAVLAMRVVRAPAGNASMVEISDAVHEGAMAFLRREYTSIILFVALLTAVIGMAINWGSGIAFVVGALCSMLAGFIGMQISTRANTRTAQAATVGFGEAMAIAFPGGAVMGMAVVGLGLLGLSLVFAGLGNGHGLLGVAERIAGFSMGASSVALFARVGGGIYTKAADVGADLVGKVEAGIPEDDPRNPAVIGDNVGDNVGDVAGMGADLFESYVGTVIAAVVIATTAFAEGARENAVNYAFGLVAVGIVASIIGVFFVRSGSNNPQGALRNGTVGSAVLFCLGALGLTLGGFGDLRLGTGTGFIGSNMAMLASTISGLISGMVVGFVAEYYTSGKQVEAIAKASETGAATNIIAGFAIGLKSTVVPLIVIGASILVSYYLTGQSVFGIALAAIGMLSITGMTVAVDAYGPIADNAGGIAEMAHLGPEVREITDSLDAAGNTTAAIAKGYAIGSAALTALALFTAYIQKVGLTSLDVKDVRVLVGMLVGGIVPFLFAADTMRAVGRAAFSVVEEVRRQFREIDGIMEGKNKPEYARCVDITTRTALREMVTPGILAVAIPLVVGCLFGPSTLGGLLAGSLIAGLPMALLLANAGGAWDNAKKFIEQGNLGGKGSDAHKAAVVGDTVGDPFKDTSGPALNILLKLMAIVSLVFAPLIMLVYSKINLFGG